jgi:hypothetical protein
MRSFRYQNAVINWREKENFSRFFRGLTRRHVYRFVIDPAYVAPSRRVRFNFIVEKLSVMI